MIVPADIEATTFMFDLQNGIIVRNEDPMCVIGEHHSDEDGAF